MKILQIGKGSSPIIALFSRLELLQAPSWIILLKGSKEPAIKNS